MARKAGTVIRVASVSDEKTYEGNNSSKMNRQSTDHFRVEQLNLLTMITYILLMYLFSVQFLCACFWIFSVSGHFEFLNIL